MKKINSTVKSLFSPVDMTQGVPWKKIAAFTMPMLIGNIAQQLYNTVDSIVVGKYIGDSALAAVGSAGPIVNLLIVLFVGISVGASVMVSQYFGAGIKEGLSKTIGNCITLTAIASLIIMIAATMLAKPMLMLLNTPDSIIEWSTSYLQILFLGSAGLAFFNILSGVLRGLGDSITALLFLLISSVVNIALDLFFVVSLGMGVEGVAYATIIAQGISGALCIIKLRSMSTSFILKRSSFKLKREYAGNIIKLGVPSGVTQAILAMSMLMVQALTNSFGETLIAANVIIMRVDGFVMLPNQSFGNGLTTYAGQNVGAGNIKRVRQGAKQGTILTIAITFTLTIIILIFGKQLMGVFTNTEELINLSIRMIYIMSPGYIAMGIAQCLSGTMRGAGDTMTPMWIAIVMTVGIRVPLAYLMTNLTKSEMYVNGRPESIFLSLLISLVIGAILSTIFYKRGKWEKYRIVKE